MRYVFSDIYQAFAQWGIFEKLDIKLNFSFMQIRFYIGLIETSSNPTSLKSIK
jgi:hypothetical protein